MLKKLRWRFIQVAMIAFFAVIFTLSCFVNVWNYLSITNQQDEILLSLYEAELAGIPEETDSSVPLLDSIDRYSPEVPYMIRFFSVQYSDDTVRINQDYIASLTNDEVKEYADKILTFNTSKGYYNGYRYLKKTSDTGTSVLFLNSEREIQTMKTLLIITVVIAGVSLAVVFLLVTIFSKYAISPYVKNIEAQKQFITNASHELKTPLTSISTSADVLAMENEDNEWVTNIQNQSVKLSKLITNLVTLSRLDEEQPFPNKVEFSLSEALWEISESFYTLASGKGKKLTQDIEDNLMYVGDKESIQQAISILLDNAIKYSPDNGEIILQAHKKNKKIEILVSNTCNEKIENINRLFDRFYRNDISHSNKISGSGIGLSIAKATVNAMNGEISVKECEDKLNFIIRL